jgi:FMN phosphatase YigB (HAD superfamily)
MSDLRLLVTDLDNTLYDWVTFFAQAFEGMVVKLVEMTGIDRKILIAEFKIVHQHYGNSEQPFSLLELPSLQKHFGTTSRQELLSFVDPALHAFNQTRKAHLQLYPTVRETLEELSQRGVILIAHTEAAPVNAYWRLQKLGIANLFRRLYSLEGHIRPHPDLSRTEALSPPPEFLRLVPKTERKPNPVLLADICAREGVEISNAVYVGDSLTRDISMAKEAGVTAVWAKYGTVYDQSLWGLLVSITHWTDDDVKREGDLKRNFGHVRPDAVIERFSDLKAALFACGQNFPDILTLSNEINA